MSTKYLIRDQQATYFLTFTTVRWIDALSRPYQKDVVIDSLAFCQKNKGLLLHAYVIMSNHVHLIASAKEEYALSAIIRDLKKHTSKQLYQLIDEDPRESRKSWMKWLFQSAGQENCNNRFIQVWQQGSHAIELFSNEMLDQRLEYLHQNPVKAGLVYEAHHYIYSSARDYAGMTGLLELDLI